MNKEQFINAVEDLVNNYSVVLSHAMKWRDKKEIVEFELFLDEFINKGVFDPVDRIALQQISEYIANELRFDDIIFYYSTFHNFYNEVRFSADIDSLSLMIYQMNIQIGIMRIQIRHGHVIGCSEDDYYFDSRGPELVDAIEIYIQKLKQKELLIPMLYLLLNYMQSLIEYRKTGNDTYSESADELIDRCKKLIDNFCAVPSIKDVFKGNSKIYMFLLKVYNDYYVYTKKDTKIIKDRVKKASLGNRRFDDIWALNSVYEIDKEIFRIKYERIIGAVDYDSLYTSNKIIFLKNYIRWLRSKNENKIDYIKVPSFTKRLDNSWFHLSDYFNGYAESFNLEITQNEIDMVNGYNDAILREKLAKLIINIDPNVLEREARKPHGALEIADMELPIRLEGNFETRYLCIPVKSGVEIQNKVKEPLIYQVIKPFVNFSNKAIVVFVSAKEATEGFYNYVKRAKANLNLDIYVIDGITLVKLFKYNDLID